jgi:hypothetical protein
MSTALTISLSMNAWREILARIFEGFEAQDNVSPLWLVNPATKRRLKLDRYYPDVGIALRFVGLTAKGQQQSDWEILEDQQRDQTRAELCRLNNVQLGFIDPLEDSVKQLDDLLRLLSRASRQMAQSTLPDAHKRAWMPRLNAARESASRLRAVVARNPEQMMTNLGESWRDRELNLPPNQETKAPKLVKKRKMSYTTGMRVRHERFGEGVITGLGGDGDEATITILFDGDQKRTFLASLVQGKLDPVE